MLGFFAGFLGIGIGLFIYLVELCSLKSFGVSYLSPYAPLAKSNNSTYFVKPAWKREHRDEFLKPKNIEEQNHISMKWRN